MAPRLIRHHSRLDGAATGGSTRVEGRAATGRAFPDVIPASPPLDVSRQVGVAQRVLRRLDMRGHEVRFDIRGGCIRIELRDADGNVLREITPAEAVDIATSPRALD